MLFVFGEGGWIWWHGALALAFAMLLGVVIYAWRSPEGPGAGGILMTLAFFLAWSLMLAFCTVDVVRWSFARQDGWGIRIGLVLLAWIAVGVLWTFLFWATDPNYPEKLLPGRILFAAHSIALYFGNLWMLSEARA
jgi:hypothetical protein